MWQNAQPTRNKNFSRLYPISIPIIAITGGIGCGKSLVIKILKDKNIPVISADDLIKKIYKTKKALLFISQNFPQVLDSTKQSINFAKLRQLAFDSTQIRESLEAFLYPQLEKTFLDEFKLLNKKGISFIVYEVPLLFEKNLQNRVDKIICIGASVETQIKRIMQRDQSSEQLAKKILAAQMSLIEKKKKSDIYIHNNSENFVLLESLITHLL